MIDFLKDKKSSVSLVDRMMADSALKTVNAARCSYDSKKDEFDDKDQKLTKFLWKHEQIGQIEPSLLQKLHCPSNIKYLSFFKFLI